MEIIYKAFDGKIFDDEDDCLFYEKALKLKSFSKDIICLDEKGKLIPIEDDLDDVLDQATFLKIQTDEAADFIYQEYGYIIGKRTKGTYIYNEIASSYWVDFDRYWEMKNTEFSFLCFVKEFFEKKEGN